MSSDSPPGDGDGLTVHGVVQSRHGDTLRVAVSRAGCSGCAKKSGCGIGRLSGAPAETLILIAAHGDESVGDTVKIAIDGKDLNRASALAYLLPAASLILGAAIGDAYGGDTGAALGAISGLLIGVLLGPYAAPRRTSMDFRLLR